MSLDVSGSPLDHSEGQIHKSKYTQVLNDERPRTSRAGCATIGSDVSHWTYGHGPINPWMPKAKHGTTETNVPRHGTTRVDFLKYSILAMESEENIP